MENIKIDEKNKKRIQRYIKQQVGFYGYEQDISLLEKDNILTEKLARKVFSENKEITIYYKFNILNMGKEDNKLQNVG